ncbi:MAG: hypothetical protein ACC662_11230 [Planctomycetota bacterium]
MRQSRTSGSVGGLGGIPERRDQFARLVREAVAERSPEAFLALEERLLRHFLAASGHVAAGVRG